MKKKIGLISIIALSIIILCIIIYDNSFFHVNYYVDGEKIYTDTVKRGKISTPPTESITKFGYIFRDWYALNNSGTFNVSTERIFNDINLYCESCFDQKELPIIEINTEENRSVSSKTEKIKASIKTYDTLSNLVLSDSCKIKIHGSSSAGGDKPSYQIKIQNCENILGVNNYSAKWVLVSNCYDKTLSRNTIAYSLMKDFSEIKNSFDFTSVDLYLNGEYKGVYLLCAKPYMIQSDLTVAEGGVPSFLLEMTDEGREIGSGGIKDYSYIISNGRCFSVKYPDNNVDEYDETTPASITAIQQFLDETIATLYQGTWQDIIDVFDVDSFATSYFIQELFANTDVGGLSFYLCNTDDGKLSCGPVWDFDIGGGNVNYGPGTEQNCPAFGYTWATNNMFYNQMLQHEEFVELVRNYIIKYDAVILKEIETANPESDTCYYNLYKDSFDRNFEKYQIMGQYVWPEPESVYLLDTPYLQFEYLYNWLSDRYQYIKEYYGVL